MIRIRKILHKILAFLWQYNLYECYSPHNDFTLSAQTLHAVLLTMLLTALRSVTIPFICPLGLSRVHEKKYALQTSVFHVCKENILNFKAGVLQAHTNVCECVQGTSVPKNSG